MNELTIYTKIADREQAVALVEAAMVLIENGSTYTTIENDQDAELLGEFRARANQHARKLESERLAMGEPLRTAQAALNAEFGQTIDPLKALIQRCDGMLRAYLDRKERERAETERRAREEQAKLEREAREEMERRQREADERRRQEQERLDREAEEANRRAVEAAAAKGEAAPPPVIAETVPEPIVAEVMVPIVAPVAPSGPAKITGTFGSTVKTVEKWTWRIIDIKKVPERFLVPPEQRVQRGVLTAMAKSTKDTVKVPGIEFYDEGRINSRVTT